MQQYNPVTLNPRMVGFSQEQALGIHRASVEILSKIGIVMKDAPARRLLLDAGATESDGRIKIPEYMLADAIASAPKRIPMYDRNGQPAMVLELGKVYYGPGSDTPYTLDVETKERRPAVTEDIIRIGQLVDALDTLDYFMSMAVPSDVPPEDTFIHTFAAMVKATTKPLVYTAHAQRDMEIIYKMAVAVAGSEERLRERPFMLHYCEPISPLLFPSEAVEQLIFCAEREIPVCFPPSPNTGGGGPITVAGALALGNAECLVGLIITQLVNKGAPFLYGMNLAVMDMKRMVVAYGSPEWSLGMIGEVAMGELYGLPVWGVGGSTDSKIIDAQAGLEASMSIYSALLTRCTLVHDVGYIESGLCSSMEMLVMCDEIIKMARFVTDGIEVNPHTLALDAVARANPGSGFLSDSHTLKNWRKAQWAPSVLDRQQFSNWEKQGSQDLYTVLNERAKKILAEHQVPALSEEILQVIDNALKGQG